VAETPLPLEGVRVLDIATVIAGPGICARLGDFGADVIKIEHPKIGDTTRNLGWKVQGVSLWWKHISRNKRPITLNLSHPEGAEIFLKLVATADVLVESFRPGTLEKWGLPPEKILERNPRMIILRNSAFGQTGPYAKRPGFGTLAEAISGLAHMTGPADGGPVLPAIALADEVAALAGAYAIMVALYHRDTHDGPGQVIDSSLFENLFQIGGPQPAAYEKLGIVEERRGNRLNFAAPRGAYKTRDGKWVALSGTAQSVAERILTAIGHPDLITDVRFATNAARLENVEELDRLIQDWMSQHNLAEVIEIFEREDAALAPVYDIAQIYEDPQYKARGTIIHVQDDQLGEIALADPQPRLSHTPGRIKHAGLPRAAANEEIYVGELGLTQEDLQRLEDDGAI
jgi:crotonobetainyl-CoA:carnitine CoA-transferase CaiB-like acyl-CoA transferase